MREPFQTADGRWVSNERCNCGHLSSAHLDLLFCFGKGQAYKEPGHGSCKRCECPQFTWKAFVFVDGGEGS